MGRVFAIFALVISALAYSPGAQASRVSPMSVELEPFGRGSVARVQFVNTSGREFPIEARTYRGVISEEGELELIPADEDFIVFPPQLVVAPREEQIFRIQYIGEPELDQAQVYYLSISQLPVELEPGAPQIQVLVNFNVFVSVEPDGLDPEPRVDTVSPDTKEDVDGVVVRLANDGPGMLLASDFGWNVTGLNEDGSEFSQRLDPAALSSIIGVGIVAPGKARQFFLPIEEGVDRTTVQVALD